MANGIKIGNLDISAFKVGSSDCKVYLGDTLLYPNAETRAIATFNVTDTSNPTQIGYDEYISGFSAIEIDGVEQPSVVSAYTFSTTGEHTVKYTLTDPTSIGSHIFFGCSNLTSIVIPDSVTSIGGFVFYECSGLTSIVIPDSITSIGQYIFYRCSGLTSVNIPDGVTSIGESAFDNCISLTSIDIPSGVTSIGMGAFSYCTSLTSIDIPSGVTSIGNGTFYSCSGLTSIIIPDSITSIGQQAFYNCSGLTSCTIGSGVTSIDFMTFASCKSLTGITCLAVTPPSLESSVFFSTNNCPIYVPSGSVDAYKAASSWSSYTSRIQAIP